MKDILTIGDLKKYIEENGLTDDDVFALAEMDNFYMWPASQQGLELVDTNDPENIGKDGTFYFSHFRGFDRFPKSAKMLLVNFDCF